MLTIVSARFAIQTTSFSMSHVFQDNQFFQVFILPVARSNPPRVIMSRHPYIQVVGSVCIADRCNFERGLG